MPKKTSVLIVDDSPEYRGILRDALGHIPFIEILDEAEDGIQGLYHVLRFKPDVVLMDLEMPKLDGMTALQHIMIHRPTPTIVFSSLSQVGSARAFDVLKNGAVDFFCKDILTDVKKHTQTREILQEKVMAAAMMKVPMHKAFSLSQIKDISPKSSHEKVIFCEDCGNRMVVNALGEKFGVSCDRCGDVLVPASVMNHKPTSLTVFVGDKGAFFNILHIVPELEICPETAIICILDIPEEQLDTFTQYLDSISQVSVIRGAVGTIVECGNCYLFTRSEHLCLKPYSTSLKLQHIPQQVSEIDPIDLMLASVAKVFKNQSLAVFLSGKQDVPMRGIEHMKKNGASIFSVISKLCMYTQTTSSVAPKLSTRPLSDAEIIYEIENLGKEFMEVG